MAISALTTRRFALLGALVSSVALAVPAVKAAAKYEPVELAADRPAMPYGFRPKGYVPPETQTDRDARLGKFLRESDARTLAQYHAGKAAECIARLKGGHWEMTYSDEDNFLLLVGDMKAKRPAGLYIQEFGWTIGRPQVHSAA